MTIIRNSSIVESLAFSEIEGRKKNSPSEVLFLKVKAALAPSRQSIRVKVAEEEQKDGEKAERESRVGLFGLFRKCRVHSCDIKDVPANVLLSSAE